MAELDRKFAELSQDFGPIFARFLLDFGSVCLFFQSFCLKFPKFWVRWWKSLELAPKFASVIVSPSTTDKMFEIYTFFENTTEIHTFFENRTEIYTFFENRFEIYTCILFKNRTKISNILSMVDELNISQPLAYVYIIILRIAEGIIKTPMLGCFSAFFRQICQETCRNFERDEDFCWVRC